MLTLLGSLLGFGTSIIPKVIGFFEKKRDQSHELAMLERRAQLNLQQTETEAAIREVETIHEHDAALDGGGFINGLRASVRPVITYVFMGLFVAVEVSALTALLAKGLSASDSLDMVWDDQVQALFATILAFWFGGRVFGKS